jgi:uncharacterized protein YuzE
MVFHNDAESDMLYIRLAGGVSVESEEVAPGVVLDFDEQNHLVGVEIEDAGKVIDLSRLELRALPVADLILSGRITAAA